MATKFIKEIFGDFVGNLGNLFEAGKDGIKMLKKSSKKTIKNPYVYCARPMVKEASGFGFESIFCSNALVAEEFANQDHVLVQFHGDSTAWVTGAKIIDGKVKAHPKLDRAAKIQIKNPKLYSAQKTDPTDGTKYTEYFLRVDESWQVEPFVDPYRAVNLIELAKLIGQNV